MTRNDDDEDLEKKKQGCEEDESKTRAGSGVKEAQGSIDW